MILIQRSYPLYTSKNNAALFCIFPLFLWIFQFFFSNLFVYFHEIITIIFHIFCFLFYFFMFLKSLSFNYAAVSVSLPVTRFPIRGKVFHQHIHNTAADHSFIFRRLAGQIHMNYFVPAASDQGTRLPQHCRLAAATADAAENPSVPVDEHLRACPRGEEPFDSITVTTAFGSSGSSARRFSTSKSRSERFFTRLSSRSMRFTCMISARIEIAISSGVTPPIFKPIGLFKRLIRSGA